MKKLPIGISTFSEIRTEGHYYVDKTGHVQDLVSGGKYYFLSRPRRFGKSLFVDTLKCAFEGKKELFHGLHLEPSWDWSTSLPVLSFSFGRGRVSSPEELATRMFALLDEQAQQYGVSCTEKLVADRFAALIRRVSDKQGKRVVILVDEYDKPILDNLENTFLAGTLRDGLKDFYSVLKESDAYIRFCFITGVSKFSRVSIFSDLNNLEDISLDPQFGDICGYTEEELTTVFADRLDGIDVNELRHWYNGYSFLGENRVYNPFDVLLFFKKQALGNYWFESATPSFLINLLRDNRIFVPNLDGTEVGEAALSSFTIDHLLPETVLFQSGYLTIKESFTVGPRRFFRLGFPNQEVRLSFTDALLAEYTQSRAPQAGLQNTMYRALEGRDMDRVRSTLQSLFSAIPAEWYTRNNMDRYEGYYAAVIYAFLASLGFDLRPEESTSHGRCDLVVDTGDIVYVMEFKVTELTGDGQKALAQIRERGYHHSYVQAGREVVLVGMDFSRKERNLTGFEYEPGNDI